MLTMMMALASALAAAPTDPTQPVYDMIDRVIGSHHHFQLVIDPHIEPLCFRLADVDDLPGEIITVHAQDASLLAPGVGWFLRERANMTIGTFRWGGSRLTVPKGGWPQMKTTGGPAHVCRQVKYSYMMNVCTHSYSLVWYSWQDWEVCPQPPHCRRPPHRRDQLRHQRRAALRAVGPNGHRPSRLQPTARH